MDVKKLGQLKSLLLRSWRERWPDTYWSIQAKHLISKDESHQIGVTDLLLQQAMAGSSPNLLVLSYFKHALNTQMITYKTGLEGITKFEDVTKVYCVKALVEIVEQIIPQLCSKAAYEDSWQLAKAALSLLHWLLSVIQKCAQKVYDDPLSAEYATVVTKASVLGVLDLVHHNSALTALLHVISLEDKDLQKRMSELENGVRRTIGSLQSQYITAETRTHIQTSLNLLKKIGSREVKNSALLDSSYQALNVSINVFLHIEVLQNPTIDVASTAQQLVILSTVQGLTVAELLCEIFRTCFMGMINTSGSADELKWAAFTYLKVPQLLLHMSKSGELKAGDVVKSLELCLHYTPLLDLTDTKSGVDSIQLVCNGLAADNILLLSQAEIIHIMDLRKTHSQFAVKADTTTQQSSANLILRAEPTVKNLLQTLEADYSKNLENMYNVMGQMMAGKSFELLLTAAAYTGQLQAFAAKLIKFSEFAKQSSGENGKAAQTRAYAFDSMFVMLCHIAQTYGVQVCHSNDSSLENSFFVQWARVNLPEDGQYKALDQLLTIPDEQRIEGLLSQIQPGAEIKTSLSRWNELCVNMQHAVKEVLYAWEYNLLTQEQVQSILDNVRGKMCCLPIAAATFLCSYINNVDYERRQKPLCMLEHLMTPVTTATDQAQNSYFSERCHIMHITLMKLSQDVLPLDSIHHKVLPQAIPRHTPIQNVLQQVWTDVFNTGSITCLALLKFDTILNTAGCQWFCSNLVTEMLRADRVEDLYKGACLLYSLFSLDLSNLTVCLLRHTIPGLLQSSGCKKGMLTGPRSVVLSKLTVSCMLQLHIISTTEKGKTHLKSRRKRTRNDVEFEDSDLEDYMKPAKLRKSESPSTTTQVTNYVLIDDDEDEDEKTSNSAGNLNLDPLSAATASLLRLCDVIIQGEDVSENSYFIKVFLQEVLTNGQELTRFLVQFIPSTMVLQMVDLMPSQCELDLILSMCDLSNSQGRKTACKAICQNKHFDNHA